MPKRYCHGSGTNHAMKGPEMSRLIPFISARPCTLFAAMRTSMRVTAGASIAVPSPMMRSIHHGTAMMFISGAEDKFADRGLLELLMGALNPYAHLMLIPEAGHSLELPDGTKRSQEDLYKEIADILLWFMSDVIEKKVKCKT